MKNPLRLTTDIIGIYAGLIAIQHGIFEILQGDTAPDGLMFNAIGPNVVIAHIVGVSWG